jgi:hypothetical protein
MIDPSNVSSLVVKVRVLLSFNKKEETKTFFQSSTKLNLKDHFDYFHKVLHYKTFAFIKQPLFLIMKLLKSIFNFSLHKTPWNAQGSC